MHLLGSSGAPGAAFASAEFFVRWTCSRSHSLRARRSGPCWEAASKKRSLDIELADCSPNIFTILVSRKVGSIHGGKLLLPWYATAGLIRLMTRVD